MLLHILASCCNAIYHTTKYVTHSVYSVIYNFILRPITIIFISVRDLYYLPLNLIIWPFWHTTLQKILYDFSNISIDNHLLLISIQFFIAIVILGALTGVLTGLVLSKLYNFIQNNQFVVEVNFNLLWLLTPLINLLQYCESSINKLWNFIISIIIHRNEKTKQTEVDDIISENLSGIDIDIDNNSVNTINSISLDDTTASTNEKDIFYNVINELPSNFFQDSDRLDSTIQDTILTPPLSPLQSGTKNLNSRTEIGTNISKNTKNKPIKQNKQNKQRQLSIHSIKSNNDSTTIWNHYNNNADFLREPIDNWDKKSINLRNLKRSISK